MSGIFQHLIGIAPSASPGVLLTGRTVNHPGLTETAATDTAALDLQHHTVLGHLDKRNQRAFPDTQRSSYP